MARTLALAFLFSFCCIASGCGGSEEIDETDTPRKPNKVVSAIGSYDNQPAYLIKAEAWTPNGLTKTQSLVGLVAPVKSEYYGRWLDVTLRDSDPLDFHLSFYVDDTLAFSAWLPADYKTDPAPLFVEEFLAEIEFTEVAPVHLRTLSGLCFTFNEPPIPACKPYTLN